MTELRSLVADDKARQTEWLRKRDEAREPSYGPPPPPPPETLVPGEDVTPDGDLAPCVTNYRVVGWKTNSEKEVGITRECSSPGSASVAVGVMLAEGCYQIIVESPVNRPPPIF